MEKITEKSASKLNGFLMLFVALIILALAIYILISGIQVNNVEVLYLFFPLMLLFFLVLIGLTIIQPNDSRVLILFGKYIGTVRQSGFWWVNPFTIKRHVSLRIRNFNSEKIKVNDLHGNPIEIAAVVVWKVVDSARAIFETTSSLLLYRLRLLFVHSLLNILTIQMKEKKNR